MRGLDEIWQVIFAICGNLHQSSGSLPNLSRNLKRVLRKKRTKTVLSIFSDLEHYCLQLLAADYNEEGKLQPSRVARQFQKQFSEILVDEYQDTNLVQETILSLISDQTGAGNR